MNNDLISRESLKKRLHDAYKEYDGYDAHDLSRFAERVDDEIDNAPAVEEMEKPCITERRDIAIENNLPLYFVYYEETGVFEVYITETKELFEKRHCSKYLSHSEFADIATRYLDEYSDWRGEEG